MATNMLENGTRPLWASGRGGAQRTFGFAVHLDVTEDGTIQFSRLQPEMIRPGFEQPQHPFAALPTALADYIAAALAKAAHA